MAPIYTNVPIKSPDVNLYEYGYSRNKADTKGGAAEKKRHLTSHKSLATQISVIATTNSGGEWSACESTGHEMRAASEEFST